MLERQGTMTTRTTTLKTALEPEMDKLLGCIHCGLCLPVCPTYVELGNENDSPRGRIYLMRAVADGRLDSSSNAFARHIDLCLGCRACETACPAGVRYGSLLEAAREEVLEHKGTARKGGLERALLTFALRRIFPYPNRLRLVFRLLRALRGSSLLKLAFREGVIRDISPRADFAASLLLSTAESDINHAPVPDQKEVEGPSVTVFTGCVMEGLYKGVNEATSRVLAINGSRLVEIKAQVCCGALHAHSGDLETARQLARRNIDAFESREGAQSRIVVNAAGCGALLKEYGELLQGDSDYALRARAFSSRVRDVTEYLAEIGLVAGAPIKRKVTLDAPCHLYHAQRVTTAPQRVLGMIPGLEYVPLEGMHDCCGGAGTYNLSEPELSEQLLAGKMSKVKATGAEVLVTANPGCQMQLSAGARLFGADCKVAHIIELVDESYRAAGMYGD
jgi:glycolate oxidase iron-sulfur subunit